MKNYYKLKIAAVLMVLVGTKAVAQTNVNAANISHQLQVKDSLYYSAIFNTCNTKLVENTLAKDFVFYQDQGYSSPVKSQPRADYLAGIYSMCDPKANAPKMRREVVKGSLQVFITGNNEAMQTGVQHFYVENQPEQLVEESKFSRVWHLNNGQWQIISEMDYLYNTHLNDAKPAKGDLNIQIANADSVLFAAFNNQDIEQTKNAYTKDVEFYHDKDGLQLYGKTMSNFAALFGRNKSDALHRELVPGTMRVYPISNYGAIETGEHRFSHMENGQEVVGNFKFAIVWKKTGDNWQVIRAISYGHVNALQPGTDSLYNTVVNLDNKIFNAFNAQNIGVMGSLFAPDLEFYQDNEGVENYDQTMQDFKTMFEQHKNDGLRRELVPGSLEVYPLSDYGAIEVGEHRFCHTENGKQECGTFKFINIWNKENGEWKLTRTLSYGH